MNAYFHHVIQIEMCWLWWCNSLEGFSGINTIQRFVRWFDYDRITTFDFVRQRLVCWYFGILTIFAQPYTAIFFRVDKPRSLKTVNKKACFLSQRKWFSFKFTVLNFNFQYLDTYFKKLTKITVILVFGVYLLAGTLFFLAMPNLKTKI